GKARVQEGQHAAWPVFRDPEVAGRDAVLHRQRYDGVGCGLVSLPDETRHALLQRDATLARYGGSRSTVVPLARAYSGSSTFMWLWICSMRLLPPGWSVRISMLPPPC